MSDPKMPDLVEFYDFDGALSELAANLLRVVAGGGEPHLVVRQIAICSAAIERDRAKNDQWPSPDDIRRALDHGFDGYPPEHQMLQGAGQAALSTVVRGSLRLSAAGIWPNPTERSKALTEIERGARELSAAHTAF